VAVLFLKLIEAQ